MDFICVLSLRSRLKSESFQTFLMFFLTRSATFCKWQLRVHAKISMIHISWNTLSFYSIFHILILFSKRVVNRRSQTNLFDCTVEIVPANARVSRKSCGATLYLSCYTFTKNFNYTHHRLGKHVHLKSKFNNENLLETKTDMSIFLASFIFIVTYTQQLFCYNSFVLTGHSFKTLTYPVLLKHCIFQILRS